MGILTAILGLSWPVLGVSWGHLGHTWCHLGATRGLENVVFVREVCNKWEVDDVKVRLLWHPLFKKLSKTIVCVLTAVFGLSRLVLGASWGHLAQMWGHLGDTRGLGDSVFVKEVCKQLEIGDVKLSLLWRLLFKKLS